MMCVLTYSHNDVCINTVNDMCIDLPLSASVDLAMRAVVEGGGEEDLLNVVPVWLEVLVEVVLGAGHWLMVRQTLVSCVQARGTEE